MENQKSSALEVLTELVRTLNQLGIRPNKAYSDPNLTHTISVWQFRDAYEKAESFLAEQE